MDCLRFNDVVLVLADVAHVQLGHRCGAAGVAEQEPALVEMEVARDGAALPTRPDRQRARDPGSDVVAVEEQRLTGVEREVQRGRAVREGDGAPAAERTAAGGLAGELGEHQLRAGEVRLRGEVADDHAGDGAFEAGVPVFSEPWITGLLQAAANVRGDGDRARQIDNLGS